MSSPDTPSPRTSSSGSPTQPAGPGATGGLPGSGSDTPDGTGFADGRTLGEDETASTIDEADVAALDKDGEGGGA